MKPRKHDYDLPTHALSVRQPWAWAIIHGGKDIENRGWNPKHRGLKRRGRICIHASQGLTRNEYAINSCWMAEMGVIVPYPNELKYGTIIGTVEVVDVVYESDSPWFMGPVGLVLRDPKPVQMPYLVTGQLGYFNWKPSHELAPKPKKWMHAY